MAQIYADAASADRESNPLAIDIYEALADRDTTLELRLAPGGGQAIRFRPAAEGKKPHSTLPTLKGHVIRIVHIWFTSCSHSSRLGKRERDDRVGNL